jgi:fluoride exporter
MTVKTLLIVMVGGGLGAASRYGVNLLTLRLWGPFFPWGTLVVNLSGCYLAGLVYALEQRAQLLSPEMRSFLIPGFLGALTTFSAFALETLNIERTAGVWLPLVNILAHTIGCLLLAGFGIWLGSLI